ncbi:hypothetical protein HN51_049553 [Arachis hypogaea]|uniref:uncharacterized protein isoform X2 n=1 Tax=Arachis hypogaea TaxID=3818 RepID=UPI000DED86D0|nr:transcription factor JUNGBRUNNEN 1 isoform X2 [Arachis hypogaea]
MDVAKLYMNNDYSEEHEHEHEDEDHEMMKEEKEVVLPGFRFHPTDEELVGFYLRRKVEKKPLKIELIKHVDIYKYDPWDLPIGSSMGEKEWYFFCIRGRKYRNSIRPNRVTGSGFWKATGIDKPIYSANYNYNNNNSNNNNNNNNSKEHGDHHECIGLKKSLVYYRGSAGKGTKTDWMMHEFRLPPNNNNGAKLLSNNQEANNATKDLHEAEVWTLCRIFKRIPTYKKYTPNLKDSSTSPLMNKPINNINHQTDSSVTSISCSLESDNNNSKPFLTFTNTMTMGIQQCERKPLVIGHVDERNNNFFLDHSSIHHQQAPTTITTTALSSSSYSSWNQHHLVEDYLFANENWDDLRSVVEFATDPNNSKVYL